MIKLIFFIYTEKLNAGNREGGTQEYCFVELLTPVKESCSCAGAGEVLPTAGEHGGDGVGAPDISRELATSRETAAAENR